MSLNKLFIKCFPVFIFFSTTIAGFSQTPDNNTFIAPFEQIFAIGAFCDFQFTNLIYKDKTSGSDAITYTPNTPVGIGLSLSFKNFAISGGIGFDFMKKKEHGNTTAIDFQYHYYGKKLVVDFFFLRYKGFYTIDDNQNICLYPDIRIVQYGLNGQYVFNHEKFSYRAAFNQSEKQLKSAGSFHLSGGFYYNRVGSDGSLTLRSNNNVDNYQLGISGGYAYTWVFLKDFHASAGLSGGINIGTENLKTFENIEILPIYLSRAAAGYDAGNWSFGISFVLNRVIATRRNPLNITLETGYAQMTFIRRLDTIPKFFRKSK